MAIVGEAYIEVKPKTDGFEAAAEPGIASGAGNLAKKAVGIFAAAFAGAQLISFGKDAFAEAEEAQKIGAQTEAVIKSTGAAAGLTADQIGDLAGAISAKTGIDDEAIQNGENLLLTFTNLRNEAGAGRDIFDQATKIMVDMGVAMGGDASSSAIQLGKALNDPAKGITALTKVGVTFTEEQKAQIKAMQESGDMAGAQGVILAELSKEFGGSAEAQATAADKMHVAWGNFQEAIGTALMPAIEWVMETFTTALPVALRIGGDVVEWFRSTVIPPLVTALRTVVDFVVSNWPRIQEIAGRVFAAIGDAWNQYGAPALAAVMDMAGRVADYIVEHWPEIEAAVMGVFVAISNAWSDYGAPAVAAIIDGFNYLIDHQPLLIGVAVGVGAALVALFVSWAAGAIAAATATWALVAAQLAAAAPFIALGVAVAAVVAGVIYAYQNFETFRNVVDGVVSWLTGTAWPAIRGFVDAIVGGFTTLVDGVRERWDAIVQMIQNALTAIGIVIAVTLAPLIILWQVFGDQIIGVVRLAWDTISSVISIAMDVIVGVLQTAWALIGGVVQGALDIILGIVDVFIGIFSGDWSLAWQGVQEIVTGAWTIIQAIVQAALDLIVLALQTAWSVITAAVQLAWDAIRLIIETIWVAITTVISTAIAVIEAALSAAWSAIQSAVSAAWDAIRAVMQTVWDAITALITGALTAIQSLLSAAWSAITSAIETAWNAILAFITGIFSSISSAISSAMSSITSFLSGAWETIRSLASSAWTAVYNLIVDFVGRIVGFVSELPGKLLSALSNLASTLAGAATSAFQAFIEAELNGISNIIEFARGIPGQIFDAVISGISALADVGVALIDAIVDGIKGAAGRIGSAIKNAIPSPGDIVGGIVGGIGGAASSIIGGLAGGGTARSGTPYVVGEIGPELFVPGQTGTVITNAQIRAALGSGGGSPSGGVASVIHLTVQGDVYGVSDLQAVVYEALDERDRQLAISLRAGVAA